MIITFEQGQFVARNANGQEIISFEYQPSTDNLWKDIKVSDFDIHLMTNLYLNKESNVFELRCNNVDETLGYVFPLSAMESNTYNDNHHLLNYLYVSFLYVMSQLNDNIQRKEHLSDYYGESVIVCALHKRTLIDNNWTFDNVKLSLFQYGYLEYFDWYNSKKMAHDYGYKYDYVTGKQIHIYNYDSQLLKHEEITDLLSELSQTDNKINRFVLLYQIVEFIIAQQSNDGVKMSVDEYSKGNLSNTDFFERVREQVSERPQISTMFTNVKSFVNSADAKFQAACLKLFSEISYKPRKTETPSLFYDFRNQMTHSFRKLLGTTNFDETMQCFEVLCLQICQLYNK